MSGASKLLVLLVVAIAAYLLLKGKLFGKPALATSATRSASGGAQTTGNQVGQMVNDFASVFASSTKLIQQIAPSTDGTSSTGGGDSGSSSDDSSSSDSSPGDNTGP